MRSAHCPSCRLRRLTASLAVAAAVSCLAAALTWGAEPPRKDVRLTRLCELGISLALQGHLTTAESLFVSLLARSPRDPRALNNLGNVHLWRNDVTLARSYYGAALASDSADAGIALNAANAAMIAGDDSEAQTGAERAVRQAGGLEAAAGLLGMRLERADAERVAPGDRTRLNREQVLLLMRNAARAVPSDSALRRHATGDSTSARRAPLWRPAAARSAEATDEPPCVYWKR